MVSPIDAIAESLRERKADAFRVLTYMYEKTGGSTLQYIDDGEIMAALQIDKSRLDDIVVYLSNEGLLSGASGGALCLEHQGIRELEAALAKPDQPTEYFPPVNIINFHAAATNTQIQQGTSHSTQTSMFHGVDLDALRGMTADLLKKLHEIDLADDQRDELRADLTAADAQLASPNPKMSVIRDLMSSAKNILENAGGEIAADFLRQIDSLPQ